jgi:hypothetical protein
MGEITEPCGRPILVWNHTGSRSNRPQTKSAPSQIGPSQIGPKSNRPQVMGPIWLSFWGRFNLGADLTHVWSFTMHLASRWLRNAFIQFHMFPLTPLLDSFTMSDYHYCRRCVNTNLSFVYLSNGV